jgi:N-methylhydantoinase B/oxoprolinase/acetone carboxylase alpha subunit
LGASGSTLAHKQRALFNNYGKKQNQLSLIKEDNTSMSETGGGGLQNAKDTSKVQSDFEEVYLKSTQNLAL